MQLPPNSVDREQFTAIVDRMLKTPPIKRSDAKTGQPKTGKIIPAKLQK
jgi:hypothetical protein